MNFYIDGNIIGLTISSWYGILITIFTIFDLIFFFSGFKMFFLHKLIISPYVFYQIRKNTPKWWRFKNMWWFFIMRRRSFNRFEMFVELESHLVEQKDLPYVCDTIVFNFLGKIVDSNLQKMISDEDSKFSKEIKQFNRNEKLKDLGF